MLCNARVPKSWFSDRTPGRPCWSSASKSYPVERARRGCRLPSSALGGGIRHTTGPVLTVEACPRSGA
jgi:hypothetical protein